jgi:Siphovirus Gp157
MTALSPAASEAEREPHTLFDLDERLIELMDRAEEAAEGNGISEELLQEINDYLHAFRTKVDRIAGYWRWQESIAAICGEEEERFSARKRAAEGRLGRLKEMLLYFMLSRGLKKIEGEKASIGLQGNGMASLVIDDPCQLEDRFFETTVRITKTEFREIIRPLPDGEIRRKLEFVLARPDWEINSSAVRSALTSNAPVSGARLVKGHHLRLR